MLFCIGGGLFFYPATLRGSLKMRRRSGRRNFGERMTTIFMGVRPAILSSSVFRFYVRGQGINVPPQTGYEEKEHGVKKNVAGSDKERRPYRRHGHRKKHMEKSDRVIDH